MKTPQGKVGRCKKTQHQQDFPQSDVGEEIAQTLRGKTVSTKGVSCVLCYRMPKHALVSRLGYAPVLP